MNYVENNMETNKLIYINYYNCTGYTPSQYKLKVYVRRFVILISHGMLSYEEQIKNIVEEMSNNEKINEEIYDKKFLKINMSDGNLYKKVKLLVSIHVNSDGNYPSLSYMRKLPDEYKLLAKSIKFFGEYKGGDVLVRHNKNIIDDFNSFNPVIAVKDKNIIKNSNSYLLNSELCRMNVDRCNWGVHKNMKNIYSILLKENEFEVIDIMCLYGCNAFNDSNMGHALSIIFSIIMRYMDTWILEKSTIVIQDDTYKNIINILLIFFNKNQILLLEENKSYKFNNIIIPDIDRGDVMSIHTYNKIKKHILDSGNVKKYKDLGRENRKVILVKQNKNKFSGCIGYDIDDEMKEYCFDNDIMIIKPEDYDICELIYILSNASMITTSPGAISYTHMIFFNQKGKLHFIGNEYLYSKDLNFTYHEKFNIDTIKLIHEI
jgi:hypothetical protein